MNGLLDAKINDQRTIWSAQNGPGFATHGFSRSTTVCGQAKGPFALANVRPFDYTELTSDDRGLKTYIKGQIRKFVLVEMLQKSKHPRVI